MIGFLWALLFSVSFAEEAMIVPQAKFVADIQISLPKLFCQKESYFRSCFQISESDCSTEATAAVEACAKDDHKRLPASFKQPEDGQKWGQAIGTCAGIKFEEKLVAKRVDSPACKDPENWKANSPASK